MSFVVPDISCFFYFKFLLTCFDLMLVNAKSEWQRWGCYFRWLSKNTYFQVFEKAMHFPVTLHSTNLKTFATHEYTRLQ